MPRKRTPTCAVWNCGNTRGHVIDLKYGRNISLHRFPEDENICQQWVSFVKKDNQDWHDYRSLKLALICSYHFTEDCFSNSFRMRFEAENYGRGISTLSKPLLNKNAVPTLYLQSCAHSPSILNTESTCITTTVAAAEIDIKDKSGHSVPELQVHVFKPTVTGVVPVKDTMQSSGSELRKVTVKTENTLDAAASNIPSLLTDVTARQSDDGHIKTGSNNGHQIQELNNPFSMELVKEIQEMKTNEDVLVHVKQEEQNVDHVYINVKKEYPNTNKTTFLSTKLNTFRKGNQSNGKSNQLSLMSGHHHVQGASTPSGTSADSVSTNQFPGIRVLAYHTTSSLSTFPIPVGLVPIDDINGINASSLSMFQQPVGSVSTNQFPDFANTTNQVNSTPLQVPTRLIKITNKNKTGNLNILNNVMGQVPEVENFDVDNIADMIKVEENNIENIDPIVIEDKNFDITNMVKVEGNNIDSEAANEISCVTSITNMIKAEGNNIENIDSVVIEDRNFGITNMIKVEENNINNKDSNEISCASSITNMRKMEGNNIENIDSVVMEDRNYGITNMIKVEENNINNKDSNEISCVSSITNMRKMEGNNINNKDSNEISCVSSKTNMRKIEGNNIENMNSNEIIDRSCDTGIINTINVEENNMENTDSVTIEAKSCNITNIMKMVETNTQNTDYFYVNGKDCYMPGTTDTCTIKNYNGDNKTNVLVFDRTDTTQKESTQETAINESSDIQSDSFTLGTTSPAETTVKNAAVDFVSDSTLCETPYPTCYGQEEHINKTFQKKSHHQRKHIFKKASGSSSQPSIKVFIKKPNNNTVSQTIVPDTKSKTNGISYYVLKMVPPKSKPKMTPPKVKKFNASCQTRRYPDNQTAKPSVLKKRKNTGISDTKSDTVVEKQSKCSDIKSPGTCTTVNLSNSLDCSMTNKTRDDSRSDSESNTEYAEDEEEIGKYATFYNKVQSSVQTQWEVEDDVTDEVADDSRRKSARCRKRRANFSDILKALEDSESCDSSDISEWDEDAASDFDEELLDMDSDWDDDDFDLDNDSEDSNEYYKPTFNFQGHPEREKKHRKIKKVTVVLEEHKDKYEITSHVSMRQSERALSEEQRTSEQMTCKLCKGAFSCRLANTMERHLEQHLQGYLTCVYCNQEFPNKYVAYKHELAEHATFTLTCEYCAIGCSTMDTLRSHLSRTHKIPSWNCYECDEAFLSKLMMKQHMFETHPGTIFKCQECTNLLFNTKQNKNHQTICKKKIPRKKVCDICGKTYAKLWKHKLLVHDRVRRYKCSQCPYTAQRLQNFKNHLKTHTGYHPYKCDLCDFSCIQPYQLTSHIRTHTGEKPFKCDQCSYTAAWNVQLKDHKKAHSSQDKVTCDLCDVVLKNARCLHMHNQKQHTEAQGKEPTSSNSRYLPKKRRKTKEKETLTKNKTRNGQKRTKSKDLEVSEIHKPVSKGKRKLSKAKKA